jgi:protocatechuate 3,4-dioxygenase beta subunit
MKNFISLSLFCLAISCKPQTEQTTNQLVGGPCEGCEAVLEYGNKQLTSVDTLPGFSDSEPKLKITGRVFKRDGKTPAENVILYIYHTNRSGIYEKRGNEEGWAKRHGYIQGWVKTNADGNYTFYTFRPAAYPNGQEPEHVHITVKEPTRNPYYIDAFEFTDDPLLTPEKRKKSENRGGSGIMVPRLENGMLVIERDIRLGYNIPNYR